MQVLKQFKKGRSSFSYLVEWMFWMWKFLLKQEFALLLPQSCICKLCVHGQHRLRVFIKYTWSKNNLFGHFYWPLNEKKETNSAKKKNTSTVQFVFQFNYVLCVFSAHRFIFCSRKVSLCPRQGPKQKTLKDINLQTNLYLNLHICAHNSFTPQ